MIARSDRVAPWCAAPVQLRFDSPDDSPTLQTVGALRQSRRLYGWAGGFAVR
jgi:hypothetical protein